MEYAAAKLQHNTSTSVSPGDQNWSRVKSWGNKKEAAGTDANPGIFEKEEPLRKRMHDIPLTSPDQSYSFTFDECKVRQ